MHFSRLLCLTAGLTLSVSSAIANVQFQWIGLANGTIAVTPPMTGEFVASTIKLVIELTPEAAELGHLSYHSPKNCGRGSPTPVCPLVDSAISYLHASYVDGNPSMRLTYFPSTQIDWNTGDVLNTLDIEVDLSPAGLLNGTIDAYF